MDQIRPSTLIQGCDIISRYLRRCLVPVGLLYKFDPNPPHRPKPLPVWALLFNSSVPFLTLFSNVMLEYFRGIMDKNSSEYKAVASSVFIRYISTGLIVYRIIWVISTTIITLAQHGCISNVIASTNNYVTEKEQSRLAKTAFCFFFLNMLSNTLSYTTSFALSVPIEFKTNVFHFLVGFTLWLLFLQRLYSCAILIYTCYLASALGKHVENFSTLYIDTMFDQFMKAIEKEDCENNLNQIRSLPFFDSASQDGSDLNAEVEARKRGYIGACCNGFRLVGRSLIKMLTYIYNLVRNTATRLKMRRYPELPEMKMTKLSSTTNIQISETVRMANNHLIRVRLRRTQIMLSELRDVVSDINKTSSPLVMMYLVFETCLIVLITTASVQAKVYKSIDLLILPTITVTLGLVASVIYICTCYDSTTKQLKLLINKLFDFIIMNHRVQSTGRRANRVKAQIHANDSEVCIIPGSEVGAINETWSQFQYTRKLANTIHFTMGGVLPVTRRLVLSILGHILSAVFISIEVMSIVDTSNMAHGVGGASGGAGVVHHSKPFTRFNTTSWQNGSHHHRMSH